jgi:glutathione S-transferase
VELTTRNVYVAPLTCLPLTSSKTDEAQPQVQPPVLPRPDVKALGIAYRRIPLMSIGRDVYCDTRIILQKLEQLFPKGTIGASQPDQKALEKLLEIWSIDSGVFNRAAQLIPTSMPLLNDPKFTKDREDYNGRSWDKSKIEANRPEALAHIRNAFNLLETTLLADGREWILKTEKPSLGDIEGKRQAAAFSGHNVC